MKKGQRATHRIVVQFEGGKPFRKPYLSEWDAEFAARKQRDVVGPNGERCTVTVEPIQQKVSDPSDTVRSLTRSGTDSNLKETPHGG